MNLILDHARKTGRTPIQVLKLPMGQAAIEQGMILAAQEERRIRLRQLLPRGNEKDAGIGNIISLLYEIASEV